MDRSADRLDNSNIPGAPQSPRRRSFVVNGGARAASSRTLLSISNLSPMALHLPTYLLHGEDAGLQSADVMHSESIAERSSLHSWEIKPHRHESLLQVFWLSIRHVAYKLGFTDAGYFTRFFERETGSAPSAWRAEALARQ
jgi:AraC-like DNA-binding protein